MQGVDISSNNHDGEVFNWQQAKSQGYDFVYVKATQGIHYLNPYLVADVRDAFNAGLHVGVYHFYDASSGTPQEQADFFKRNGIHAPVGDQSEGDLSQFLTLMPVLDFESVMNSVLRDEFLVELHLPAGVYMNRDYQKNIGYGVIAKFGWLAWPEWTTEQLPSVTAIVQTRQQQVQGLGKPCDIDTCFNLNAILAIPTPDTGEVEDMFVVEDKEVNNGVGLRHVFGTVNNVAYHWWQNINPAPGTPDGYKWNHEVLPTT